MLLGGGGGWMVVAITAPVWLPALTVFLIVAGLLRFVALKAWAFSLSVALGCGLLVGGLVLAYMCGAFR